MNRTIIATLITILAAAAAALAFLPYSWAHIAAGSLSAALAAIHPVNAGIIRMRANAAKRT